MMIEDGCVFMVGGPSLPMDASAWEGVRMVRAPVPRGERGSGRQPEIASSSKRSGT